MKVGFIGGGKMAEAIIGGLIRSDTAEANDIYVSDISADRRTLLETSYGVHVSENNSEILKKIRALFLAVKPQTLDSVLDAVACDIPDGLLVISIAAGKKIAGLASRLPQARIARVMPNLAVLVSQGMSVYCTNADLTAEEREAVRILLASSGKVIELPEAHFDAVTALSGSGPAFFAYFLSTMIEGSVRLDLPAEEAAQLARQTMLGTATLLDEGVFTAEELIAAVTSRKGTTEAGLAVLTQPALKEIVAQTLSAAAKRSAELSQ